MIKMNEEELNKLFHRIELDKSSDSCGFEFADGYGCTFDNIATCYDDRLKLYELVKQLQNNWNELKRWLEETIKQYDEIGLKFKKQGNFDCASRSYDYLKQYQAMLFKMQELQGDDKN